MLFINIILLFMWFLALFITGRWIQIKCEDYTIYMVNKAEGYTNKMAWKYAGLSFLHKVPFALTCALNPTTWW